MVAVVLVLGGFTWFSAETRSADPAPQASPAEPAQTQNDIANYQPGAPSSVAESTQQDGNGTAYNEGYEAGYRDARRNLQSEPTVRYYYGTRPTYSRRVVVRRNYHARHHGHSTRKMLLTIGAPAAIAAGLGGIAGGGKGAGIGALLGGGGGALYYLIKHRN